MTRHMKKKHKFYRLLILVLAGIIVIPVFSSSILFFGNIVQEALIRNESALVYRTASVLSAQMKSVVTISNVLSATPFLRDCLSKSTSINEQIDELRDLRAMLSALMSSDSFFRIRIYVPDEKIYAKEHMQFFPLNELYTEPALQGLTARATIPKPYEQYYVDVGTQKIISCAQLVVSDSSVTQAVGAVILDVPMEYLHALLEENLASCLKGISLLDAWEETFISVGDCQPEDSSVQVEYPVEGTNWTLCGQIHLGIWGKFPSISALSDWTVDAALLLFVLAGYLMTVLLLIRSIARRVNQLVIETRVEPPSGRFSLFKILDESVDRTRKAIEEREKMYYQLLQAQINPHFFYNVLDTVGWMIHAGAVDNAEKMVLLVAQYFRAALNAGKDLISVRDEMALARLYVEIQNLRLDRKILMEFTAEEQAMEIQIPKMCIQPILENAIIHGFENCVEGHVYIDVSVDGQGLIISVTDDGAGMTQEQIEQVLGENAERGYGIYNVMQRIRLFSGEGNYGLEVESEPGEYTTVVMRIARIETIKA